jgi:hypothetical protein
MIVFFHGIYFALQCLQVNIEERERETPQKSPWVSGPAL